MTAAQIARQNNKIHPALSRSYWIRTVAYILGALLILDALPADKSGLKGLIIFIGFVYPTLFYQFGIRMKNTRAIGFAGYSIDAFLWSLAVIATHYSIAILLITPQLAVITSVLMLGPKRGMISLGILLAILLIGLNFVAVDLTGQFSFGQGVYAWAIVMCFMFYIALLVNQTTRSFVAARRELQAKNSQVLAQAEQLESIGKVARLVNSTLDIDQVMHTIMEQLNRIFSFTHTAILFLDEENQTLVLDRLAGDLQPGLMDTLQGMHIPMSESESAFTRTMLEKTSRYLPDLAVDSEATDGVSAQIYRLLPAKSLLIYPLIKDNKALGVISFANTDEYFHLEPQDIEHIGQYVPYVVSALRNASDFREIQESRAAADHANQAKSQFLANMSHELRTPMNAIIGYTEMLEEEAQDQQLDDMVPDLRKILSASQHLLQLINDILDLSKVEAGKIELFPESFNGQSMFSDIAATVQPLIDKNNNQLKVELANDTGELYLDQTKLRQIILNLISNAAKFTKDDVILLNAERSLEGDGDWLTVNVIDAGIGMTQDQLARVFEPFSQAEATTTREYGGTGLGLSISRKLCEMMGGSLTAQSEEGQGSTFTIRIPTESRHQLENAS